MLLVQWCYKHVLNCLMWGRRFNAGGCSFERPTAVAANHGRARGSRGMGWVGLGWVVCLFFVVVVVVVVVVWGVGVDLAAGREEDGWGFSELPWGKANGDLRSRRRVSEKVGASAGQHVPSEPSEWQGSGEGSGRSGKGSGEGSGRSGKASGEGSGRSRKGSGDGSEDGSGRSWKTEPCTGTHRALLATHSADGRPAADQRRA